MPITLRTDRLQLSAPGSDDAAAVKQHCQDTEVQRWTTVPVPYTATHARAFVEEFVPQSWSDGTELVLGIRRREDPWLMGVVAWQRHRGAIGYWLGREHRGQGYMSEAVTAVSSWALSPEHGIESLQWETIDGNTGSAHVARAAGFRWIGKGPCAVADREGRHPAGWHAVLRREHLGTVQPVDEWPVLT